MVGWFGSLPTIFQIVLAMPIVFFVVGIAIFSMEPPGDSFYGGKKPTLIRAIGATTIVGAIGTVLLTAIYALTAALLFAFSSLGLKGSWLSTVALILSLVIVLGGVAWYFEIRHYK